MTQELYNEIWHDAAQVRQYLENWMKQSPEVLPAEISSGYSLTGCLPESKKLPGVRLRQLKTTQGTYTRL